MADLRQAEYPGYVANLKEEEPGWFGTVLTAACTSQTDSVNKPFKSVGISRSVSIIWRGFLTL